jgi:hypothetical protein
MTASAERAIERAYHPRPSRLPRPTFIRPGAQPWSRSTSVVSERALLSGARALVLAPSADAGLESAGLSAPRGGSGAPYDASRTPRPSSMRQTAS